MAACVGGDYIQIFKNNECGVQPVVIRINQLARLRGAERKLEHNLPVGVRRREDWIDKAEDSCQGRMSLDGGEVNFSGQFAVVTLELVTGTQQREETNKCRDLPANPPMCYPFKIK